MCKKLLVISAFFVWAGSSMAQDTQSIEREQLRKKVETMSVEEAHQYFQKYHPRVLPAAQMEEVRQSAQATEQTTKKSTKEFALPEKKWFPGEWEPVQAIIVTWPYISQFKNGQQTSPALENLGFNSSYTKLDSITSYPYTNSSDDFVKVFVDVIDGIQQGNAQAWINVWAAADTTVIKNYMAQRGKPLTNYRFFISPGNSFWYRDCGPVAFYYGDKDEVAFLDFEYYTGRALDDLLPIKVGEQADIPVYTTSLETEGGNILVDGISKFFSSDALYSTNADSYGQLYLVDPTNKNSFAYKTKTPINAKQVKDSIKYLTGLDPIILPTFKNDGGTGHIDLYADMWDESNFVFSQFPDAYSSWTDYKTAKKNIDSVTALYTFWGKQHYKKSYIPFPTKDDGTNFSSASDYEKYTRSYTNHTFVNNVILQPVFNNGTAGSIAQDNKAIEELKIQYPGYKIIPIDVRSFDGYGGAIHCITKQVPVNGPIRVMHDPIDAKVTPFNNGYKLEVTAWNRSHGIKEVYCDWRKKNTQSFNKAILTSQGNDLYTGTIGASLTATDSIEYYIVAVANTGSIGTKPVTAPNGCYEIFSGRTSEIAQVKAQTLQIGNFFPNPATNQTRIDIANPQMKQFDVQIFNSLGQVTYKTSINERSENIMFEINTTTFAKGFYTVVFSNDNERITKKLVVE